MSTTKIGQLTAETLKEIGAFVAEKPFPAPVEWNGTTIPLYVRQLGFGALHDLVSVVQQDQRSYVASLIAAAVCFDPDGKEPMEFVTAYTLVPELAQKVLAEVHRVNGGVHHGR